MNFRPVLLLLRASLCAVIFFQGCAAAQTYRRMPGPGTEQEAAVLHWHKFDREGNRTSAAIVSFCRTSTDSGFCEFVLSGNLSNISASILFPEDVTILHSQVRYRYKVRGVWYEKTGQEPVQFVKVLQEEIAPASIPGHLLPFGLDSGYRFIRKLFRTNLDEPELSDHLENNFDSVGVAFNERRGVDRFSIRIPLEELRTGTSYPIKVIAHYTDGEKRMLNDDLFLELE